MKLDGVMIRDQYSPGNLQITTNKGLYALQHYLHPNAIRLFSPEALMDNAHGAVHRIYTLDNLTLYQPMPPIIGPVLGPVIDASARLLVIRRGLEPLSKAQANE